jgi:hypothetical protein
MLKKFKNMKEKSSGKGQGSVWAVICKKYTDCKAFSFETIYQINGSV